MAASDPPSRKGLQTLAPTSAPSLSSLSVPLPPPVSPQGPAAAVPPPPRQVSNPGPPPRQVSNPGPPPRQVSNPGPPARSSTSDGFYTRMMSGELTPPPTTTPTSTTRPRWPLVAAVVVAVGVVATAGVVVTRGVAEPVVERTPVVLAADEERALGDLWLKLAAPGLVRQDLTVAVTGIGDAVAAAMKTKLGGRTPRFRIVEHPSPRAMALPDATIAITTGLLRRLKNDAELTAVLAHCLGHVAAGHVVLMAGSEDEAKQIRAAATGASPTFAIDALREATNTVNTPEREQAADALMVEALLATKRSTLAAAEGLMRLQGDARPGDWGAIHPVDSARAQRLQVIPPGGSVDEDAFKKRFLAPLTAPTAQR